MESKKVILTEAIVLFMISFGVLFEGIRLAKSTSRVIQDVMGPRTYIIVLGGLLILGMLVHITFFSVRLLHLTRSHPKPVRERGASFTVLAMVAIIALYTALIQFLGYLIATPIFFLMMFRAARVDSWRRIITLTAILSAAYYFIFVYYCNVIFPRGIFYG
jgi:hypothetical protein